MTRGVNPYKPLEEVAEDLSPLTDEMPPLAPVAPLDPMFAGFIAMVVSGSVVGAVATFLSNGLRVTPAGLFGGLVVSLIVGSVSFGVAGAISRKVGTDLASLLTSALAGAAAGWTVASFLGVPLGGRSLAALFCAAVVLMSVRRHLNKTESRSAVG